MSLVVISRGVRVSDYLVTFFSSSNISVSTVDVKLKLYTSVQYGGWLMPIGTVDNRYSARRYSKATEAPLLALPPSLPSYCRIQTPQLGGTLPSLPVPYPLFPSPFPSSLLPIPFPPFRSRPLKYS